MGYCGLYICDTDVDNWPSGYGNADYKRVIDTIEAVFEKIVGRAYRTKNFDIKINGNDQNRIFLPLSEPILAITEVRVYDQVIDTSWYSFDENSVFVSPESGAFDAETEYLLAQFYEERLFPHGYNNIRFKGRCGSVAIPEWVKTVLIIMARAQNDPTLYAVGYITSEGIGNYNYSIGGGGALTFPSGMTGIVEADKILMHFRKHKPRLMAP
jgi:hypothetical protein